MKLRLTLIQCPPAQGADIARDLGTGRLVIGRGPDCDWVLNDPERALSKIHCMVEFKGGVYIVIDSSTNGVFLNDAPVPIGRGNSAVVGEGDRLRMGGFVMRAGFAAEEAPAANDPFLAVLRGSDAPASSAPGAAAAEDDPFALPAFGRAPMSVMPIPEDDDLFGDPLRGDDRAWGKPTAEAPRGFGGWQQTAAGAGRGEDPDWPGSAQRDFSPDSLGTMRVATEREPGASSIPDDWLDDPVDLPPSSATPPPTPPAAGAPGPHPFGVPDFTPPQAAAPAVPPAAVPPAAVPPTDWADDWADDPLIPPAFGARPSAAAPQPSISEGPAEPDALARVLADVVLSLVRRQAALEALLGLDPEDTLDQGSSILRRVADTDEALARLRALPPAEAEALLRAAVADGEAHQSALMAAVRELTGEAADGGARLAALYRRLLPIHRHALGG